jgi:hypothetical protein
MEESEQRMEVSPTAVPPLETKAGALRDIKLKS